MPTLLRSFPEVSRSGTQQTGWRQVPEAFERLHLQGQAAPAVLGDDTNAITFIIFRSPTGADVDAVEIQREYWYGGMWTPRGGTEPIPRAVDVNFGPFTPYVGQWIAMRATFNKAIVIGATLTGLP